eukprot:6176185-Pleurochrysis_carterae.AAC.2
MDSHRYLIIARRYRLARCSTQRATAGGYGCCLSKSHCFRCTHAATSFDTRSKRLGANAPPKPMRLFTITPAAVPLRGICPWCEEPHSDRTGRAGGGTEPCARAGVASGPPTRSAHGPKSGGSSAPPRTRKTRRPRAGEGGRGPYGDISAPFPS